VGLFPIAANQTWMLGPPTVTNKPRTSAIEQVELLQLIQNKHETTNQSAGYHLNQGQVWVAALFS